MDAGYLAGSAVLLGTQDGGGGASQWARWPGQGLSAPKTAAHSRDTEPRLG